MYDPCQRYSMKIINAPRYTRASKIEALKLI